MFTKEEANVLTPTGFAWFVNSLRNSLTHIQAYEATEVVHQKVHAEGKRKYSDFESYFRLQRLNRNRTAQAV